MSKPPASSSPRPRFPAQLGYLTPASPPAKAAQAGTVRPVAPAKSSAAPKPAPAPVGRALPQALRATPATGMGLDRAAMRQRMVQRLADEGIDDAAVLAAMAKVERHRFVDSALVNQAYEDTSLPIGFSQTISKPNVVARMLSLLRQALPAEHAGQKMGRVLEIGTGCGYQAALMSELAAEVYSVERVRGLHEKARDNLRPMRLSHLRLVLGDGMLGCAVAAPFDGILAACGGEAIPPAWIDQLAMGGRIVAPLVTAQGQQALVVVDKTRNGLTQQVLEAVHFVPLKSGLA